MRFETAPDIEERVRALVHRLNLKHIDANRIKCFRSKGSKARAYARIWSLPRIWQRALNVRAHYAIEVLSEHFDKQSHEDQTKTLIHELLHIPKTFSGATRPHAFFDDVPKTKFSDMPRRGRVQKIDRKTVERFYALLKG